MASRINISVPDEMINDLTKYKKQFTEKVSVICQKALNKQIKKLKDIEKKQMQMRDNPKIKEKIESLKKEREKLKGLILELGKQDGENFISIISYAELLDMKYFFVNYTTKKIYSKNINNLALRDFLTTISCILKENFTKKELNTFLAEVQENKYLDPFTENPYYDEYLSLASTIIAKYLFKKFPQIKPKSGKTVFAFNKLYVGALFEVLKNFYEISKDQIGLFEE